VVIVVALSVLLVAGLLVQGGHKSTTVSSSTVVSTASSISTYYSSGISLPGSCPDGCVVDIPWAGLYAPYQNLSALAAASWFILVGNVTEAYTALSDGVPVNLYNVTVTELLKQPTNDLLPTFNGAVQVGEVGGTATGYNNMTVVGYPTLKVGQTYVFFLTPSAGADPRSPFMREINLSLPGVLVEMTQEGPQGLFYVQGGKVYSLDMMYPQADSWIPTKVSGVPLSQFIQEIESVATSSPAPSA
jgi:hypothetical protein